MTERAKIVIYTSCAALGALMVGTIFYTITDKLVRVAVDRNGTDKIKNTEKAGRRLRGYDIPNKLRSEILRGEERLKNTFTETVIIRSRDNTKLVGHWCPCENPRRIIIAMHGWRSAWSHDFAAIGSWCRENGCSILFAEQRGQGKSGGEYISFGICERHDCYEWVKWIRETKSDSLPLYLYGISMGAATVLMAAELIPREIVSGIISDCAYTSPTAIWKYVAKNNLRISYGIRAKLADSMCKKRIKYPLGESSALHSMRECKIPVLFIHGTDDNFVSISMTYENFKACSAEKRLFAVPGADHAMSYFTDTVGYRKALADFWRDFDGGESEKREVHS